MLLFEIKPPTSPTNTELALAKQTSYTRHVPEGPAGDACVRVVEGVAVENVRELKAELEEYPLLDGKILQNADILAHDSEAAQLRLM